MNVTCDQISGKVIKTKLGPSDFPQQWLSCQMRSCYPFTPSSHYNTFITLSLGTQPNVLATASNYVLQLLLIIHTYIGRKESSTHVTL